MKHTIMIQQGEKDNDLFPVNIIVDGKLLLGVQRFEYIAKIDEVPHCSIETAGIPVLTEYSEKEKIK